MKTLLDNKEFRKAFKKNIVKMFPPYRSGAFRMLCFYYKSIIKNFFSWNKNPTVFLKGDLGDEVFDVVYESLEDIGYIDKNIDLKISPYDIIKMKEVYDDEKQLEGFRGLNITFKTWCDNFGKDRTDRIACNVYSELCKQFVNCGKFYCNHNKKY